MTTVTMLSDNWTNRMPGAGSVGASKESKYIEEKQKENLNAWLDTASGGPLHRVTRIVNEMVELYKECNYEGWDGYNASPMKEEAINEVVQIIQMIPGSIPDPEISVEPTGDIGMEWYKDKHHVFVVSVEGNGVISYAGIFGKKKETHGTELLIDELPDIMRNSIKRIFGE